MPSRVQVSTVFRTGSMPALCPATRGRLRRRAQRPLPSMMIAMCAGKRLGSIELAKIHSLLPGLRTSNRSFIKLDCIELNCYGTPQRRIQKPEFRMQNSLGYWMGMVAPDCVGTPPTVLIAGTSPLGALDGIRTLN